MGTVSDNRCCELRHACCTCEGGEYCATQVGRQGTYSTTTIPPYLCLRLSSAQSGLSNDMKPKRSKILAEAASLLWLVLLVAGVTAVMRYENKEGVAAVPPGDWPVASRIQRSPDRATLILFVHPHCPCSRATVNELARLMAETDGRLMAHVIFIKPDGVGPDWVKTDTLNRATEIPGVTVTRDDQGLETQLFGAQTSGQSMLYDKDGKLLFKGGITIGRGQEGDSAGAAAIAALLNEEPAPLTETNVFGCPLFAHDPYCRGKKELSDAKPKR